MAGCNFSREIETKPKTNIKREYSTATELYVKYTAFLGKKPQILRHGQSISNSFIIHEGRKHIHTGWG